MSAYILLMNDEEVKKLRYDDDHHHSPLFLITWGPLVHSNKNYGSPHATNEIGVGNKELGTLMFKKRVSTRL